MKLDFQRKDSTRRISEATTMTKADSDYAISSSVEEDNDTAKETNEGETRTVDKHILDTGLENDKHMATSLNRNQSISNGNIPGIKITGIESSLNTKSVAVDGIKTVKYTNGDVLGTVIKNGEGSLNTKRDDEVQQLEKDGLIPDTISENNQDESLKNASIDRGWAWVILLGKNLKHFSRAMSTHSTSFFTFHSSDHCLLLNFEYEYKKYDIHITDEYDKIILCARCPGKHVSTINVYITFPWLF